MDSTTKHQERPNLQTQLVALAEKHATVFSDPDGTAYAACDCIDHAEIHAIRSSAFKGWLAKLHYVDEGRTATGQAMQDALATLEGLARYAGSTKEVHRRVAKHDDKILIDLCDGQWQAVEVAAGGWQVVQDPPVNFIRSKAMQALPMPQAGSIDLLRPFINCNDDQWPLVVGWLIGALRPDGPYPVLVFSGEQGTAKSTAAELLRSLVDPNAAPLRSIPRNIHELVLAARNGWITCLDNVSRITPQTSDALCRLATGGGHSYRQLYTDADEIVLQVQRPTILNGIGDAAGSSDLIDRCIFVELQRISEEQRRTRSSIMDDFEAVRPMINGGLLDAVSRALRDVATTHRDKWPRMADFAQWVDAALPGDAFIEAYFTNRHDAHDLAIDDSIVARAAIDFMHDARQEWSGTCSELLAELDAAATDATRRSKEWPQSAKKLSNDLRRIAPNLRSKNIVVDWMPRTGKRREIRLTYQTVTKVTTVTGDVNDVSDGTFGTVSISTAAIIWDAKGDLF